MLCIDVLLTVLKDKLLHCYELQCVSLCVFLSVQFLSEMKTDQERVSKLLTDTVTLLCKNGLVYNKEIKVQGLLGITVDKNEVFLVHINEQIGGNVGVPSYEHSAAKASSEHSARRKNVVASSSHVVDLTRIADIHRPVLQSLPNQAPPGQFAAGRKHRPPMPAAMMIPQQQASSRKQHRLRPTMSGSPLPPALTHQFASNYMAQLHQQVARGMSPMRMTPPSRQRAVNRRTQDMMPSHTSTVADDDEDVVIVGTGHEEPSPSWSSPMRKRPLPSHASSSPASLQKRSSFHQNQKSSQRPAPAVRDSPTVIEQLSSADVTGTLELTTDDISTSIEDMIMKIAPTAVTTQKKRSSTAEMMSEVYTAGLTTADSELPLVSAEDCVVFNTLVQSDTADINSTTMVEAATISEQNSAENNEEATTEPLQPPFVYTDIACDMVNNISEMQLMYRMLLPAGCPEGSAAGIVFTHEVRC